jgi:sugar porter (SP) family MFS transporter
MSGKLRNLLVAFVCIALGGALFGYIIGITSNVVTENQLLCSDGQEDVRVGSWTSFGYDQCYKLSSLEQGILSSVNLIGALISSLICFRWSDDIGRKLEVQVGALLYGLGALMAAASPVLWGIYLGFVVYGLGIGFAMHAAPVYIAEIAPANIRGTLVSAKEAVVVTGIFLGFAFGAIFAYTPIYGWRFLLAIAVGLSVIMAIGISFIPQSPRFLLLKAARNQGLLADQSELLRQARIALKFFRQADSEDEVEGEVQTIFEDIRSTVDAATAKWTDAFKYPRPLVIGCGIVLLQQITGQPSILYFATNLFKSAGFGESAAIQSAIVGLAKLLATLFTVWRVDQYGRRKLLFVGIGMMVVGLAIIGTAFLFRTCSHGSLADCKTEDIVLPRAWSIATVAALMVYVSGYQVGFGPIAWLMISEIFPVGVRGAALSLAAIVNFGSNIAVTLLQGTLEKLLGPSGLYFLYLGLSILSILFVKFIVPETKGKTLEEIEAMVSGDKSGSRRVSQDRADHGA